MENDMYGIGEVVRRSGLSASALRFYDAAGVLTPAHVDPHSGYRWYGDREVDAARIVARLRRVGMSVADIRRVVDEQEDAVRVDAVLDRHLRRLERGLVDARRELSMVRNHLIRTENTMNTTTTVTIDVERLAAVLRTVRYAVGSDPELPMLLGVRLEVGIDALTAAATDRFRLAVAAVESVDVDGSPTAVTAPISLVDHLISVLPDHTGQVHLSITGAQIVVRGSGDPLCEGTGLDLDFPDYRRLLDVSGSHRVTVDAARARAEVAAAPARLLGRGESYGDRTAVALIADDGDLGFGPVEDGGGRVLVNREFLLQALDAAGDGQLTLELDGPIAPLVIRSPERSSDIALVMPTRAS